MSNGVKKHKNNGEKMNVKDYIVVFFCHAFWFRGKNVDIEEIFSRISNDKEIKNVIKQKLQLGSRFPYLWVV